MIICLGTTPAVQATMSFDHVAIDAVNRAHHVERFASGKSINVARVLHELGESTLTLGVAGGDTGRFIRDDLDRAGIAHEFVESISPTRTCVTMLDEASHTATELIEESDNVCRAALDELLGRLNNRLTSADVLVLSGRLAPDAGDDFYARCIRLANECGMKTIIDASGASLQDALNEKPAVVKINRRELSQTVNRQINSDESMLAAMREMLSRGAQTVVVTQGSSDTFVATQDQNLRIKTPAIQAVNPIGSGDAFAAGLAAGMVRKMPLDQMCRLGAACGFANAMTSRAGHVNKKDVDAVRARIDVFER